MSATESIGLSSTRRSVCASAAEATPILLHSSIVSLPVVSFFRSTKLSLAIRRVTSCCLDISREKKATVCFGCFFATFSARFSAIEVLPMPGRAASSIRSDLFRPLMNLSKSRRPVEVPEISLPDSDISSKRSKTFNRIVPMCSSESLLLPRRRAKIFFSAASRMSCAVPTPS